MPRSAGSFRFWWWLDRLLPVVFSIAGWGFGKGGNRKSSTLRNVGLAWTAGFHFRPRPARLGVYLIRRWALFFRGPRSQPASLSNEFCLKNLVKFGGLQSNNRLHLTIAFVTSVACATAAPNRLRRLRLQVKPTLAWHWNIFSFSFLVQPPAPNFASPHLADQGLGSEQRPLGCSLSHWEGSVGWN